MSKFLHTVGIIPGADPGWTDHLKVGLIKGLAYGVGGSAGAAVSVNVAGSFPANYSVFPSVGADLVVNITAKTPAGFTVNIEPRLAANTIAAGTLDLFVIG